MFSSHAKSGPPRFGTYCNKALLPALLPNSVIPLAQGFNSNIPDSSVLLGARSFVWGAGTNIDGVNCSHYFAVNRLSVNRDGVTLARLQADHPDWLLYLADKTTLAYLFSDTAEIPVDFQNGNVWAYVQQRILLAKQAGYTGIALDNTSPENMGLAVGHYDLNHNWVAQYSGSKYDRAFIEPFKRWVNFVHSYASSLGMYLVVNTHPESLASLENPSAFELASMGDIHWHEGAFINAANGKVLDANWTLAFNFIAQTAQQRGYVAQVYLTEDTLANAASDSIAWASGNFLLVKGEHSYMSATGTAESSKFVNYPAAFSPNIGSPLNLAYKAGSIWQRDYQTGFIAVNPSSTLSASYTVPASTWLDQFGNVVSAGTNSLAAGTGIVLVKQQ